MPTSNYRFGVSLLSKSRYADAYDEEVMIDKLTGEVLVKSPTGDIISYDYNSRIKSQIATIKSIANNMSIYGDIISIELDSGVHGPFTMDYNTNYITTPLNIAYTNCKKILFNVDIDPITVNDDGFSFDRNNMAIELSFVIYYTDNSTSLPYAASYSLSEINSKVLNLYDDSIIILAPNKTVAGIQLTSFKIKNEVNDYEGNIVQNSNTIRPIFNSILAVIQV